MPFMPLLMLLTLLSNVEEAVKRALAGKEEKERLRVKNADDRRRDAAIAEQGLDRVFDGNWHGSAGSSSCVGMATPPTTSGRSSRPETGSSWRPHRGTSPWGGRSNLHLPAPAAAPRPLTGPGAGGPGR
ncbi:hypothetical protein [Streptomyces sp. NPDC004629]|uniref:hypothetical protein n=1 Tax=Streptomyces sp. NPDC004629 TaxID=3364705 RepID=UPI003674220C